MQEAGIALGLVVLLGGGTLVAGYASWEGMLVVGTVLVVLGLVLSVPGGIVYHLRLWRALAPRGALGRRWWLKPTEQHGALTLFERPGVMLPFYVGAAGFGLAMLGCAVVLVGVIKAR